MSQGNITRISYQTPSINCNDLSPSHHTTHLSYTCLIHTYRLATVLSKYPSTHTPTFHTPPHKRIHRYHVSQVPSAPPLYARLDIPALFHIHTHSKIRLFTPTPFRPALRHTQIHSNQYPFTPRPFHTLLYQTYNNTISHIHPPLCAK